MKTLVLHLDDRSTDFLKEIYKNIPKEDIKVITLPTLNYEKIVKEVSVADRVLLLGHGTPWGLLGWKSLFLNYKFIDQLENKADNVIYIWCHASDYVNKMQLSGFATGMFISEVGEAFHYSIRASQKEIDFSNNLFASLCQYLIDNNIPTSEWNDYLQKNYTIGDSSKEDPVIKYNKRIFKYF